MAGVSSTGWEITVVLGFLLSPYLPPGTQQVQKGRVQFSRQASSVEGIRGKLSSEIMDEGSKSRRLEA